MRIQYFFIAVIILIITLSGCKKEEANENIPNQAPECEIISPSDTATIHEGDTVTFKVEATDADGKYIEISLYVDGDNIFTKGNRPYSCKRVIHDGNHEIIAKAKDEKGFYDKDTIHIYVEPYQGLYDFRDGKKYDTVLIGKQVWTAENLDYAAYGCYYDNDPANGAVFGRLYTWEEACNVCPDGWHLPSDEEWKEMEIYLGMNESEADSLDWRGTDEGKMLKSRGRWHFEGNGNNASGFNAKPAGSETRPISTPPIHMFYRAYFWTSNEKDNAAKIRMMDYARDDIYRADRKSVV